MSHIRVLCIGDIVGQIGRTMIKKNLTLLKKEKNIDYVIANGENSSDRGRGITSAGAIFLKNSGVDTITSGNHIWQERDVYSYLQQHNHLLRPANFPNTTPGVGFVISPCKDVLIGVINVQGRIFMREHVDCPFRTVDTILSYMIQKTKIIVVDFHAEASSEKVGLGFYLDGRVSAVVGTHTHVQTADEQILPQGTAFITDLGMVGSQYSMLGMKKEPILRQFVTQMPVKFEVETSNPVIMTGVIIDIDMHTGLALHIERIKVIDHAVHISQ
jgi:metallophosphoesterase (TIGR00282 family)